MHAQIETFIRSRFRAALHSTALTPQTPLFSTGIIDSFGVLELLAFLEQTFGVDINPARYALDDFDTIDKIAALVAALSGKPSGHS